MVETNPSTLDPQQSPQSGSARGGGEGSKPSLKHSGLKAHSQVRTNLLGEIQVTREVDGVVTHPYSPPGSLPPPRHVKGGSEDVSSEGPEDPILNPSTYSLSQGSGEKVGGGGKPSSQVQTVQGEKGEALLSVAGFDIVKDREEGEVPSGDVVDVGSLPLVKDVKEAKERGINEFVVLDDRFDLINPGGGYLSVLEECGFDSKRAGAMMNGLRVRYCEYSDDWYFYPKVVRDEEARGVGGPGGNVKSSLNPYLALHNARSSAYRSFGDLLALDRYTDFDVYVNWLMLGFPRELSKRLASQGFEGIKKAWDVFKEFRDILEETIPERKGKLGFSVNLHLWRSSNPFMPYFHFHVTFPNVAIKMRGGVAKAYRVKPLSSVNKKDRDLVRRCWREALESIFPEFMRNLEGEIYAWVYPDLEELDEGESPYLKLEGNEERIKKYLAYSRRGYALDLGKFVEDNEYSGEDLTPVMKEFVELCVNYTHSKRVTTRSYGWWVKPGIHNTVTDLRYRWEIKHKDWEVRTKCEDWVYNNWNYSDRMKLKHFALQFGVDGISIEDLKEFSLFWLEWDFEEDNVKSLFEDLEIVEWVGEGLDGEFRLKFPEPEGWWWVGDINKIKLAWRGKKLVKIENYRFHKYYCLVCGKELVERGCVDGVPESAVRVFNGDVV